MMHSVYEEMDLYERDGGAGVVVEHPAVQRVLQQRPQQHAEHQVSREH